MNSSRPTLYDVARLAEVSTATVSFTFSKPDRVKPATRDLVLKIAGEIGYVPRASARDLARGKTGALGLYSFDLFLETQTDISIRNSISASGHTEHFVDSNMTKCMEEEISYPKQFPLYVDEIQRGFEIECRKQGLALILSSSGNPKVDLRDFASRVDGLAVFPGNIDLATLSVIAKRIPVVLLSRFDAGFEWDRIVADNAGGMKILVDHLTDVHNITSFGFIGDTDFPEYAERFTALKNCVETHAHSAVELVDSYDPNKNSEFSGLENLIKTGSLPESLVCGSDQIAFHVLDFLKDKGIHVPGDVIVTGFDGILAGRLSSPKLTTVRQPMEAMGILAVRLLVEHSKAKETPFSVYRMATQLITGESCGCNVPNSQK